MAATLSINHVGEQFQLAVTGTPVALTLPTYTEQATNTSKNLTPRHALIYTNADVRWRADGVDPNPTMGMVLKAGAYLDWTEPLTDFSALITRVKFVSVTGTATLEVAFFT